MPVHKDPRFRNVPFIRGVPDSPRLSDTFDFTQQSNSGPQSFPNTPPPSYRSPAAKAAAQSKASDANLIAKSEAYAQKQARSAQLKAKQDVKDSVGYYTPNILNDYETYTYSWAIHMINPTRSQDFEDNLKDGTYITLAESGVENEISIETVIQQTTLGFVRENRNAVSNSFDISFIEAKGMTFLNRIMLAAREMGIKSHLEACYLLELKFRGWNTDDTSMKDKEIGPYYYVTNITDFLIKHQDGATNYQVTFIETEYAAYRRMDFHLNADITVNATNFGEFLDNFQLEVNTELNRQASMNQQLFRPNVYEFGTEGEADDWKKWKFDSVVGDNLQKSSNVSVSGSDGILKFVLHKGTSMTAAIAAAVLQTKEFKKIPLVGKNQFAKDQVNDTEIEDHLKLSEMMKWFMFKTNVKYKSEWDKLAKRYPRVFTYNISEYIIPHGIHDPQSFGRLATDRDAQEKRLNNYLIYGLLKKRYDYTFTGLNSEVLDFDLSLNKIFFVTQPLNLRMGANSQLSNLSSTENARLLATEAVLEAEEDLQRKIDRLKDLNSTDWISGEQVPATLVSPLQIAEAGAAIVSAEETLKIRRTEAEQAQLALTEETNDAPDKVFRKIPKKKRYITQSELYKGAPRSEITQESLNAAMQFDYKEVNDSLAVSAVDANDDPGAAMLGALEINLNSTGELVEQRLNIRGDPYWLGKPKGVSATNSSHANYEVGGVGYFFNMQLPVYENEDTGFMPDSSESNFGVTALYRVSIVTSQYTMGEFKQTLQSIRDTNTNNEMLITQLLSGEPTGKPIKSLNLKSNYQEPIDDVLPNEPGGGLNDNSTRLDPNASGNASGNISGDTTGVDNRLLTAMSAAGTATGLDMVVTSGDRGPGGSGRHNGFAADTQLRTSDGRILSVENPSDLALIQNYTQAYLNETRAQGLTPSVGIANPAYGTGSELYMSGTSHHFDIAMTPGIGANLSSNAAPYWGGSTRTKHHKAPTWLVNMYNAAY
tara:strand:- start:1772 stop:4750 length:2979 start_codon:yes stop_codon:yes gene_type:complete